MSGKFEGYEKHKVFWFWMALTIGVFVSDDEKLSARKSTILIDDFLDSSFYPYIVDGETKASPKNRFTGMG